MSDTGSKDAEEMAKIDSEIKKINALRSTVRANTTVAINALKNLINDNPINADDIEDQMSILDLKTESLNALNKKMDELIDPDRYDLKKESDKVEEYRTNVQLIRTQVKRKLRKAGITMENLEPATSSASSTVSTQELAASLLQQANNEARLPPLVITKYSGEVTEWIGFWSQYSTTVDSKTSISKVQKFAYLKSYLTGDALSVMKGLSPSDENYDEVIDLLTNRFGRKDMVSHAHMQELLTLEPVTNSGDLAALRKFYDACEINIRSLRSIGLDTMDNGAFLCPKLIACLPKDVRLEYTKARGTSAEWDLHGFIDFLRKEVESRETCERLGEMRRFKKDFGQKSGFISQENHRFKPPPGFANNRRFENKNEFRNSSAAVLNTTVRAPGRRAGGRNVFCIFCKSNTHPTSNCKNFTLSEKKRMIEEDNRCSICTRFGHETNDCTSYYNSCKICKGKHNAAICEKNEVNKKQVQPNENRPNRETIEVATNSVTCGNGQMVLLQTAEAIAKNPDSESGTIARCLLDQGSQASFVTEDISRKLKLPIVGERKIEIKNFGNEEPATVVRKLVKLTLENAYQRSERVEILALEVPYICEAVETARCEDIKEKMRSKQLQLADQSEFKTPSNSTIGILIGGDTYWEFVSGQIERFSRSLVAVETTFGWAIGGPAKIGSVAVGCYAVRVMKVTVTEKEIMKQMEKFWSLEAMGIQESQEKETSETEVMENFKKEIKKEDGRYYVKFPWSTSKKNLPDNEEVARKRMETQVRRFNKDPAFYEPYKKVIEDQLCNGIVEVVENPEIKPDGTYYLPQQGVIRPESLTTKFRVVNDGSSHAKGAPSLNDCMSCGPNLNPDLLILILKFRRHLVAITADIEKAFLQVGLAEDERDSVRFFWVKEEDGKINEKEFQVMRMTRVPFGITASPYLLAATIKTHVQGYVQKYPETCEVLDQELYVDDLTTGKDNIKEAFQLTVEASEILKEASMTLRKWNSNSAELRKIFHEETNNPNSTLKFEGPLEAKEQKILGLTWEPEADVLSVDLKNLLNTVQTNKNSKRFVLSVVAQMFDPVGIISPYTMRAKFVFQELWKRKLDWDSPLPEDLSKEFQNWLEDMKDLEKLKLPRCYYSDPKEDIIEKELHCFTDASKKAYAAVIFMRYVNKKKEIKVSFVASKTRVAPLSKTTVPSTKELTIPRLELMGCLLGARLINNVKQIFKENIKINMWTDSTIARDWIKGQAKLWKPFIQNRINEIQSLIEPKSWSHCPGKENPADLPTRGATPQEMIENSLWFHGPPWLGEEKPQWPTEQEPEFDYKQVEEEKRKVVLAVKIEEKVGLQHVVDLTRYSDINKTLRIIAYLYRIAKMARKEKAETGEISTEEINHAENMLIRDIQKEDYGKEIKALKENKDFPKDSTILTLKPKLNEEGLLCVGGRLDDSEFSYAIKHPIILNKTQQVAQLIMKRCHEAVLHSGIQATVTEARERFWIIAGRQLARNVVRHCYKCRRYAAKPSQAPMGTLPKERITQSEPFAVVGLDFAGPLTVKMGKNIEKAYICLYTCATTRAIHLELVPSLSTYEFLMSLRRIIARRGIPSIIYSDNAQTFKRAKLDLDLLWKNIDNDQSKQFFTKHRIQWKSIVEKAPWIGGFYERLVKSVKLILKKVLGKAALSYQELTTVLLETEAVINSRPLTYVFNTVNEPEPLCPAQFLTGKRLTALPHQKLNTNEIPKSQEEFTKRLQYRNSLMDKLWKRWRQEYVLELRTAHHINLAKNKIKDKVKIGDVMLVHEEKIPKHMWKLGVVSEVKVGRDGEIRSCSIKMGNQNVIRRPIQLLYPLEINQFSD